MRCSAAWHGQADRRQGDRSARSAGRRGRSRGRVYFPDGGSARAASARIAAAGWNVAVKPSGAEWYVAADQQNVLVDDARLGEAVRFFEGITAETSGAQWDGYEASI